MEVAQFRASLHTSAHSRLPPFGTETPSPSSSKAMAMRSEYSRLPATQNSVASGRYDGRTPGRLKPLDWHNGGAQSIAMHSGADWATDAKNAGDSPQGTVHKGQSTRDSPQGTVHKGQSTRDSPQGSVAILRSSENPRVGGLVRRWPPIRQLRISRPQ